MSEDNNVENVGNNLTELQKQLVEAMYKNVLNITKSCGNCGIDRTTFYRWQYENPAFKTAIDAVRKQLFQAAESPLFDKLFGAEREETKVETFNGQIKETTRTYFVEPDSNVLLRVLKKNRPELLLDDDAEVKSDVTNINISFESSSDENNSDE
jgi:hypothetical protein